jgi:hypothetical protein
MATVCTYGTAGTVILHLQTFMLTTIFYNDRKYALSFSPTSQHKKFSFFNNIFVASDTADIYNGIDSSTNKIFLGNVWMRKSGGF